MEKPVCLITGATDGVGKFTAFELARRGFTVIFAARDQEKAERIKATILAMGCDVDYILTDLASLSDVRSLAEDFKRRYSKLDVLINNAGIFAPSRQLTVDGFETSYQINYLSHFLLTKLLLRDLLASEQGRIINLSSKVHSVGKFDPENLQSERKFSLLPTYASTKLLMLLFTIELAKRLYGTKVTANAVHPGIVRSRMMWRAPGMFRLISYLALPFSVSPQRGAATSVFLATSPNVRNITGEYFVNSNPTAYKTKFNTEEIRQELWRISEMHLLQTTPPVVA
jgi:retinol dehydrogenase-12